MLIVPLAMVVVLSTGIFPETSSLIEDLGSRRYASREAAGVALEKLGTAAVPALRAAITSTDPEIRARSTAILARVEAGSLTRPTMVTLDYKNAPLAEVIASINARAGLNLAMISPEQPGWTKTRLDCRSNGPVPFWSAIDMLCGAGHIRHEPGGIGRPGLGEAAFPLQLGAAVDPGLTSDSGPFRVQLTSIHFQSDLSLTRNAKTAGSRPASTGESQARRQFYLQVAVAAEPRLTVAQDGPARISLAVDDRGNSLLTPPEALETRRSSGYLGVSSSPSLQLRLDLSRPDSNAEEIRMLRGEVPVVVAARKAGSRTVELAGAIGQVFRDEQATYTVEAARVPDPDQTCQVRLAIRPNTGPIGDRGEGQSGRIEPSPMQIELLGDRGESLAWFPTQTAYDGDVVRTTIALASPRSTMPVSIRFHEINRVRTTVPFEFRSIAMP